VAVHEARLLARPKAKHGTMQEPWYVARLAQYP
jgi:hypothetical protein